MVKFEKFIEVRWADCDANRHVRHSTYYDYGAHARIRFFTEIGFDVQKLGQMHLGPILFKEECSFIRELHQTDTVRINLLKGDVREDGARWVMHHELFNQHDKKCAHITIKGAWMDLNLRKLTIPPVEVAQAIHSLPRGEAFVYKK